MAKAGDKDKKVSSFPVCTLESSCAQEDKLALLRPCTKNADRVLRTFRAVRVCNDTQPIQTLHAILDAAQHWRLHRKRRALRLDREELDQSARHPVQCALCLLT